MIPYEHFVLENGLRVYVIEDASSPLVCVNVLYDVGARDEDPELTGFAHLFEHLMFGGSVNIPNYDEPLQRVGGDNNAFTTNDLTNYYCTVPAENIETAFWLESDRMLSLAFTPKSLDVQRQVVIEEFKQRYLNQPYGDVWLLLRPLVYKKHPYQWATIGKSIAHIEQASMNDVKAFFKNFYTPSNAILVVCGKVTLQQVRQLSETWFSAIPAHTVKRPLRLAEPIQTEARKLEVHRDVPANALYRAYRMCARKDPQYPAVDVLSDILGRGNSARLYNNLVLQKSIFSDVSCYVTAEDDPGLLIISGKLMPGISFQQAELELDSVLKVLCTTLVNEAELLKCIRKYESSLRFSSTDIMNKASHLAIYAWMGHPEWINTEFSKYELLTPQDITDAATSVLNPKSCSTLYYYAKAST